MVGRIKDESYNNICQVKKTFNKKLYSKVSDLKLKFKVEYAIKD